MTIALTALRFPFSHGVRFGPLRLSAYGLCACAGLLLAMTIGGRGARRAGLAPDVVWDTGLFAIISCFVASRLLLVLRDPAAFVHFPLLMLGLPSLTFGGMGLAALMVLAYVRVKKLPLRALLDAFAAPGAVLAAALEVGHWIDGSEPGMPFRSDSAGGGQTMHLHPVALYGVAVAVILAMGLWTLSNKGWRPGQVAALGLMLGGLAAFGLDCVSQPPAIFAGMALEPGEMAAVAAMFAGALLWTFAPGMSDAAMMAQERLAATSADTLRMEGKAR